MRANVWRSTAIKPELRPVSEGPLEIVEERPVEVAADVDAVLETAPDALERVVHVRDAAVVVVVAEAVLGHVQRCLRDLGRMTHRHLERSGPELVAHRRHDLHAFLGPQRPAPLVETSAGIRLHTEEVVAFGALEELPLVHVACPVQCLLGARGRPPISHGDAQADREVAGTGLQHVIRTAVRGLQVLVHPRERVEVAPAGREHPDDVAHQRHDVRFVDRAAHRDEITEVGDGTLAVPREAIDDLVRLPAAERGHPARGREVVERHDRSHALLVALGDDAPVVVEGGARELAVLGLDARPLDREAIGAEAELAHEADVLRVAVVAVAAVARRLDAGRAGLVLERPPVVVPVAAFDLVRGRCCAPHEVFGEGHRHGAGA